MTEIRRNPLMRRFLSTIAGIAFLTILLPLHPQSAAQNLRRNQIAWYEQKLENAKAAKNYKEEVADLLFLARLYSAPGEQKQALDCYSQALSLVRWLGDRNGEAQALSGRAQVFSGLGHKQLALEDLNQALEIQRSTGDSRGQGATLNAIGDIYSDLGQDQKARQYYQQASNFPSPRQIAPPKIVAPPEMDSAEPPPTASAASEAPQSQAAEPASAAQADAAVSADIPASEQAEPAAAESQMQQQAAQEQEAAQAQSADQSQEQAASPDKSHAVKTRGGHTHDDDDTADAAASAPAAAAPDRTKALGHAPKDTFTIEVINGKQSSETLLSDAPIERYPNIEAPDSVEAGQEIAVQVSLTSEQISPETKILSGSQNQGKLQLQMAEGENQWTLTVNLTAPGLQITRGGTNTTDITIARDGDSSIAVFYLRAQPLDSASAEGKRDTRILATLWHNGAFLARLSRPLTIVAGSSQASANHDSAPQSPAPAPMQTARPMHVLAPRSNSLSSSPAVRLDPSIVAPDLTIIENRIGDMLRLTFYSAKTAPVEADIPNADELHEWINAHFSQMASRGRGFNPEPADPSQAAVDQLHAADYLNAFGAELYDRFAPQAFKDLFFQLWPEGSGGKFNSIQIFSDDPSLPWELMRPASPDGRRRGGFLGATFSIARWPLSRRGSSRPPQSLTMEQSVVIAPGYRGTQMLKAANQELATLKSVRGFTEVAGDYASVRKLAGNPPQGIVHFAGHGAVMDQNGVPQFTILLEDSQMDPATWQQLGIAATTTHPLFFFNACDVGESRQFMNDVDGWAPALLGNGASGYIGALWPVKDDTAALFAKVFYSAMNKSLSSGNSLNVASLLAQTRARVFLDTGDATALAYVFYGDPRLVLTSSSGRP